MIKENSNADVVFMLDCTGSMGPYIENTKSQIRNLKRSQSRKYFENELTNNIWTGDISRTDVGQSDHGPLY